MAFLFLCHGGTQPGILFSFLLSVAPLLAPSKIQTSRKKWYNRLDPFLFYDHSYEVLSASLSFNRSSPQYKLIPEIWLTFVSVAFFAFAALTMTAINGLADFRQYLFQRCFSVF